MTRIQRMRRNFTIVLAFLAAINTGLLAYLIWPGRSNQAKRRAAEQALQKELADKRKQAKPLEGVEAKLAKSREDVKKMYQERVPARFSDITDQLHKLALENGVMAQRIQYDTDPAGLAGVERVKISTIISGDYIRLAHFISALERDKLLFVVRQITLSEQQGGAVDLQIRFDTFIKEKS